MIRFIPLKKGSINLLTIFVPVSKLVLSTRETVDCQLIVPLLLLCVEIFAACNISPKLDRYY
jgi:hypothetical protein